MNNGTAYTYEAEKFAVSENGLHLLRNRFNYETISWNTIETVEVRNGKDLRNWLWVLFVGVALAGYAIYDIFYILFIFNDPHTHVIYVERLVLPVIPLSLGLYSIFIALRNTRVMVIKGTTKTYFLSLRYLIKSSRYSEFISFMQKKNPQLKYLSK
jgi:hypothetical protein